MEFNNSAKVKPFNHYTLHRNSLVKIAGLCYFKDNYHVFDLHPAFANNENDYVVGHGISSDALTWKNLHEAVYPTRSEDIQGVEDCCSIVIDDKLVLFYLANRYSSWDEDNISVHHLDSVYETNLFMVSSVDGINFDNAKSKKKLLGQKDFEENGIKCGSIEAICTFDIDFKFYVSIVALDCNLKRIIVTYLFDSVDCKLNYIGTSPFYETKYRVTSFSINTYDGTSDNLVVTTSVNKLSRTGAFYIPKDIGKSSRSYCIMASFDKETGSFKYFESSKNRYDNSEDITSIKAFKNEDGYIMAFGCIPSGYSIRNANGMFSSPRRIEFLNGRFIFSIHPLFSTKFQHKIVLNRIKGNYLPIRAGLMISNNSGINICGVKITLADKILKIDRSKLVNEDDFYTYRKIYEYQTEFSFINLVCIIDQHIMELIFNDRAFLTLHIPHMTNELETYNEGIKIQAMSQFKFKT